MPLVPHSSVNFMRSCDVHTFQKPKNIFQEGQVEHFSLVLDNHPIKPKVGKCLLCLKFDKIYWYQVPAFQATVR